MDFYNGAIREKVNIVVRNPRTHLDDGKAQFTDYEVELKTNHIAFTVKHSRVRRRYSDFVWLRNRLDKDLSTSMPPVLPGRKLFGRFNKTFIKHRQAKLQEFLNCLVTTELFLSHAAVHLFLQTKLSVQEIENFIDSQGDDNASDEIGTHSLRNLLLMPRLSAAASRERLPSRPDSGFDSCSNGDDMDDCGSNSSSNVIPTTQNDDVFNDIGHLADQEDNDDDDIGGVETKINDFCEDANDEENMLKAVEDSLRKLSMSSSNNNGYIPNIITDHDHEWDSSIEYLYSGSSESETRCGRSHTVPCTPEKRSNNQRRSYRGSFRKTRLSQACSLTTMPCDNNNSRNNGSGSTRCLSFDTKEITRRRSVSLHNCFHGTINVTRLTKRLERSESAASKSDQSKLERSESGKSGLERSGSGQSKLEGSGSGQSRLERSGSVHSRLERSGSCKSRLERNESNVSYSPFKRPTVKRKISLNEYCIVKRDSYFSNSVDANDFNTSLDF